MIKPLLPLFASLTLGVVANGAAAQASPAALSLQVYNADAGSFHVNAVLVSGKTDAVPSIPGLLRQMRTGSPRWFSTAARR
jgi:ADP-ribosylglycohydrolase